MEHNNSSSNSCVFAVRVVTNASVAGEGIQGGHACVLDEVCRRRSCIGVSAVGCVVGGGGTGSGEGGLGGRVAICCQVHVVHLANSHTCQTMGSYARLLC
jgi:hypothetical protein